MIKQQLLSDRHNWNRVFYVVHFPVAQGGPWDSQEMAPEGEGRGIGEEEQWEPWAVWHQGLEKGQREDREPCTKSHYMLQDTLQEILRATGVLQVKLEVVWNIETGDILSCVEHELINVKWWFRDWASGLQTIAEEQRKGRHVSVHRRRKIPAREGTLCSFLPKTYVRDTEIWLVGLSSVFTGVKNLSSSHCTSPYEA